MRTILLGMCNPNADGDPLSTRDGAGRRLFEMSGMVEEVYQARFERRNLVDGRRWSDEQAYMHAVGFKEGLYRGTRVVALGKSVAKAIDVGLKDFFDDVMLKDVRYILIPHPSGRCRLYNDSKVRAKVRKLLVSL